MNKMALSNGYSLLFLDIDGVLNSSSSMIRHRSKEALEGLRHVIDQTGCSLVIASSWRENYENLLMQCFHQHGLGEFAKRVIGVTPVLKKELATRENEIDLWLHRNACRGRLAILDEFSMGDELAWWQVRTDQDIGLISDLAVKVVAMLSTELLFFSV